MFRSNDAASMVLLFQGLITNSSNFILDSLSSGSSQWILQAGSIVGGTDFFIMERISNLERVSYMFTVMVLFHWVQYSPEILTKFRKHDAWMMPILGAITILMLAMLSQDGGEFIYYKF
jgi:hypothetical protein